MEHRKKIILESIADYETSIMTYKGMLKENEKRIESPKTSQIKKEGFQMMNDLLKIRISECQKQIMRLLGE